MEDRQINRLRLLILKFYDIMNFERLKFNAQQENRLEALKSFKKKCGYIFKGSLVNISNERKCILVQDWLGPEGQKIYDSLDWSEDEDVNDLRSDVDETGLCWKS